MKNGGHQPMNYHRNTLKGEPALFFHHIPVAEWKGAQFLCFIFYFCFFCRRWEWQRRPPHLPQAVQMAAIWFPPHRFSSLGTGSAALSETRQEHRVTSNSHPVLPPSQTTYLTGPIYIWCFYSVNWDAPGTDLRLRNPFQSLCAEETVGQIQYSAVLI